MNPFPDALPTSYEVARSPHLAVTGLLHEALYVASLSLRAAHPDLTPTSPARVERFLKPSAEIAMALLPQMNLLRDLLARYRAVVEAEHLHPWAIPAWKATNAKPF